MNIYQKLQKTRVELQNMKLTKSGKNQSIEYFELGDFLPHANSLCDKNGLYTKFQLVTDGGIEKAILTVYNTEEPTEKESFIIPTAEVDLPRGQKIQGLGAKITYLRRYVMMIAFEIADSDKIDSINKELTEEVAEEDKKKISKAKDMAALTKVCGELKNKYKISLITPLYDEAKTKLDQKESKA
jgi:hypothetical protein